MTAPDANRRALAREVARRRTFAIISHPDAGKTTLTEKLLLFGGAVREAGAVRARRAARHATSDCLAKATVTGNAIVEEGAVLFVNSTVLNRVRVGAWATVAAGSLVTRNVEPYDTVMGIPARSVAKK